MDSFQPPAFCNTTDKKILSQVLNDYDQETADFYRWKVTYSQEKLQQLFEEKLKMNFGAILDIKQWNVARVVASASSKSSAQRRLLRLERNWRFAVP